MRNVLLSLVVVAALIAGAVGGALATWSDSETSEGNYVETGSVDLKVNGADDLPWGTGVPVKVNATCVTPCMWYGPYEVELWNAGQCEFNSSAYMHVKNVTCWNIPPKVHPETGCSTGYEDPPNEPPGADYVPQPSLLKPEPELVAEYGGKVNCVWVPGIGPEGDDCSLKSNVLLAVTTNRTPPMLGAPNTIKMEEIGKWECKEIYLFDLAPCQPKTIYVWVKLDQKSEEDYLLDLINPDPWDAEFPTAGTPEYTDAMMHWLKFNDWPSWALMKDKVTFDIEFDLVLWPCVDVAMTTVDLAS
jgi:predicted ribosomally synthesized peptide with SipW-like signal peptide